MEKLSKEERKTIIGLCMLDNSKENIKKVASDYNITPRYVYKLLKSDIKEEVSNSIVNNGSEFTKKADKIINLILEKIEERVLYDDKTTLQQLSTTLGILYDKSRLENNLSTSNNSININIKVEK